MASGSAAFLRGATKRELTRLAVRVQNQARRNCPVDTGRLRGSITFRVDEHSARVGSNVEYALGIEVGTGIYGPRHSPIVPVRAKVLVFKAGGGVVYARSVRGRKATPYLRPALNSVMRGAA